MYEFAEKIKTKYKKKDLNKSIPNISLNQEKQIPIQRVVYPISGESCNRYVQERWNADEPDQTDIDNVDWEHGTIDTFINDEKAYSEYVYQGHPELDPLTDSHFVGTEEFGYTMFFSDKPAKAYSQLFLEQTQSGEDSFEYIKTERADRCIALPVSCIESAQWSILLMKKENAGETIPDEELAYGSSELKGTILTDGGNTLDIDEEMINSQTLAGWADFNFAQIPVNMGDGIFIYNTDSEGFHAVAVVAAFPDGEIIVVERNAGETIMTGYHSGDSNWLMNCYDSPQKFKDSMEWDDSIMLRFNI